jgi:hypothetical protein
MEPDPPIDEIRRIRHEISADCDHDPKKLVAYYKELQSSLGCKYTNLSAESPVVLNELVPGMQPPSATAHP